MTTKQILNFINGEHVAAKSGKTFENRSPVDNRLVGMVSEGHLLIEDVRSFVRPLR